MTEKVIFTDEDGSRQEFYCLEQTRIGGVSYLLVTDDPDEDADAEAWILKDLSQDGEEESVYVFVEDDEELDAVAGVFSQMLDEDTTLS